MSHQPRKRFGQNFLQNPTIIQQIIEALHLQANDKVIEIGPGLGALTKPLLGLLNHLTAIEIDRDLQAHLINNYASTQKLTLLNADALTVDYAQLGNNLRILGNLPYNVATPLIIYLLSFASHIMDMHFMLQKEVVLRLSGQPGTKDYGRLSVMVQYHCEVEYLFDVPPDSFYPKPKVDSAIVRLVPHRLLPFPAVDITALQAVVATSFSMRRKTLANNVKSLMGASQLIELGIDPGLRPEQIAVIDYVRMARYVTRNVGEN